MYKTEQEEFWAGVEGANYIDRNSSPQQLYSKIAMWSNILRSANSIRSIRELGCNIGLNLIAIKKLCPEVSLSGYEINEKAIEKAKEANVADIHRGSILDPINEAPVDLTFTSGVLIHINPNFLSNVYDNLVGGSNRYVLVSEYYNPTPTKVRYRGCEDRLFKRDFAGDLIDNYNLKFVDYGFIYRRDKWAPQDDVSCSCLKNRFQILILLIIEGFSN